mgnify:CR=1 FL=1
MQNYSMGCVSRISVLGPSFVIHYTKCFPIVWQPYYINEWIHGEVYNENTHKYFLNGFFEILLSRSQRTINLEKNREGIVQTKAIHAMRMIVFRNCFSLSTRCSCAQPSLEFCEAMFLDCFFNLY